MIKYWNQLKTHPLAYNIVLAALALLSIAIIAHLLMQVGTRHGAHRAVPDFTGIPLDQAQHLARKNSLTLYVNDSLFVPAYEGGVVLDQLPEKGVEVKPGRRIYITINSFSQKMVPVPYVAGRSLRQAKNMLEIGGLEIAQLIYRPDMATNYVLEEYCDGKHVVQGSQLKVSAGSGVTLYVGVEEGHERTVTPQLLGSYLKQAKNRLWELGLNLGKVIYDPEITLLNQRDARIYMQTPGHERSVVLGTSIDLHLTLDNNKVTTARTTADKQTKALIEERLRAEREQADSISENPDILPSGQEGFLE